MITVGLDFGTHQTKICYEKVEAGVAFYDVFRFDGEGGTSLTSPSLVRLCVDGKLRYGHDALADDKDGRVTAYFKQKMFSWKLSDLDRADAEWWSILYLTYIVFKLDAYFGTSRYIVHMGMPTDADPLHYGFCKRQAIKVMASAMLLARKVFKGRLCEYLQSSYAQLSNLASECLQRIPSNLSEAQRLFPILVFPEAYVALIPLINNHRLPDVGPSLFVDIGGGTVDVSFFTNQMDLATASNRPCLYYYSSVPYGLNMITEQDLERCHNVDVQKVQITPQRAARFRDALVRTVDGMMTILKQKYKESGKTCFMPFPNLCAQMLDGRPICYSGGGSMFKELRSAIASKDNGVAYNFSYVTTVSLLIDHAKLYVDDKIFPVLTTAFALSHGSIRRKANGGMAPDAIQLVSIEKLFEGIRMPQIGVAGQSARWERKKNWNW